MKNTLSVKDYIKQKPDIEEANNISIEICKAIKRAWTEGKFSLQPVNILEGSNDSLDGYRLSFKLRESKKNDSLNIKHIHEWLVIKNQDWFLVDKLVYKNLKTYLNLDGFTVFNRYSLRSKLDKYFYTDYNKYLKWLEKSDGSSTKRQLPTSMVLSPESYQGERAISVTLVFVKNSILNQYIKKLEQEELDTQED